MTWAGACAHAFALCLDLQARIMTGEQMSVWSSVSGVYGVRDDAQVFWFWHTRRMVIKLPSSRNILIN